MKPIDLLQQLAELSRGRAYWLALVVLGLILEATALYYQYYLNEWPCVFCIHIRIWIFALILIGLIALSFHSNSIVIRSMHGLTLLTLSGLTERNWQVLAVERGWVFGDCTMDLGMPNWFALDQWFPAIFEVKTSCGYTPLIAFNISMAEVLLVVSVLLLIIALALSIGNWFVRD